MFFVLDKRGKKDTGNHLVRHGLAYRSIMIEQTIASAYIGNVVVKLVIEIVCTRRLLDDQAMAKEMGGLRSSNESPELKQTRKGRALAFKKNMP